MDLQKIATYSSAAAVVGTGAIVGGGQVIDNINDGPAKRQEAQIEQIRQVVAEEVFIQLKNAWPETSGPVKGTILKQ
jgi:hypothetical protein|tara:strand:+ start:1318 stop:1548 length:231 start_codon:yes stop_codon:yes gene_type:complete